MSTLALTDSQGSVKESFAYDPYGNLTKAEDKEGLPAGEAGRFLLDPSTSFLYTGRELDSETGLYYNRARFYDPQLGRFITTDPKGYEAGLNLYTYTRNNPLSFNDPLGLDVGCSGGGWYSSGLWGAISGAARSVANAVSSVATAVASTVASVAGAIVGTALNVVGTIGQAIAGKPEPPKESVNLYNEKTGEFEKVPVEKIPPGTLSPSSFETQYHTFQGIKASLKDVAGFALGVKITGPVDAAGVIGSMFAGPLGVSSATANQATFDPVAGLFVSAANIEVGRTDYKGGISIPVGPFSFSPLTVNSSGQASASVSVNAGIQSQGFDFSFGSAGLSIRERRK